MITLTTPLWRWASAQGSWHFVTIPAELAIEIRLEAMAQPRRGFGSVRVVASIGASTGSGQDVEWRTSIFPQKSGDYILPVKAEVRRRAGLAAGDEVKLTLDLA